MKQSALLGSAAVCLCAMSFWAAWEFFPVIFPQTTMNHSPFLGPIVKAALINRKEDEFDTLVSVEPAKWESYLIDHINDSNPELGFFVLKVVNKKMIQTLFDRANPHLRAALCQSTGNKDVRIRWLSAACLGNTGQASAEGCLLEFLEDEGPEVRRSAIGALGQIHLSEGAAVSLCNHNESNSDNAREFIALLKQLLRTGENSTTTTTDRLKQKIHECEH